MSEIKLRRPAKTWKGELPVVIDRKAFIPDNEDRAARIVDEMISVCGIGFEAQQHLYQFAIKQLDHAKRDCGHDACQHIWKRAALDNSMGCIRCGMLHDTELQ